MSSPFTIDDNVALGLPGLDTDIATLTAIVKHLQVALTLSATWWQLSVIVTGVLFALWVGQRLQLRLEPATKPGFFTGLRRTAVRTGVLVTVPFILWLWLLAGSTLLRHWRKLPTDILHYAILLAGALTLIRMGVFVLRHSFSPGSKLKAWEGALTFTIWSIIALHILGWMPFIKEVLDEYAVTFGDVRISLLTISSFFLSIALLMLLALWTASALHVRLMRAQSLDMSVKIALVKLSKFLLLLLAVIVALINAGIDFTALTVFGGALAVGLGLGLQRTVSNFVSGFVLIFEKSIHPGDVISVAGTFGVVQSLNARYVVVRTGDGLDILIPNEELVTSQITNWCYDGDRKVRLRLPMTISFQDAPEQALAILQHAATMHPRVLKEPKPEAHVAGFGDHGVQLELGVWIHDPERGLSEVRSDLYLAIWQGFQAAGITIPQKFVMASPARGASPVADN